MAGYVNKVIIVGRLGADPELSFTGSGMAVARLRVATTDVWVDKNTGQRQERTEWHRIVAWGRLAEQAKEYLSKGRLVYIEGRLQTRSYEKDGITRYSTEIIASVIKFLDSGRSSQDSMEPTRPSPVPPQEPEPFNDAPQDDFDDSNIPF